MDTGKFQAKMAYHTLGQKDENSAPFVILQFEYTDHSGNPCEIKYLGSLSDKARPYTIDYLRSIGYKGELKSYNEIRDFTLNEAKLETEDITIVIGDEEYNGKTRYKVKYFYKGRRELTDAERDKLCKSVYAYVNKAPKAAPKAAPKKAAPKRNAPTKKQEAEAEKGLDELFDADENVDGSEKVPF